jgi:hypothetical protein
MKDEKKSKGQKLCHLLFFLFTCTSFILHTRTCVLVQVSFKIHPLFFGVARSQKMICVPFTGSVA